MWSEPVLSSYRFADLHRDRLTVFAPKLYLLLRLAIYLLRDSP